MSKREHKAGKNTGYETDGVSYWVAPMYVESWKKLEDQQFAWDAIVATTVSAVAKAKTMLRAEQRRWWESLIADLGMDASKQYACDMLEGRVYPVGDKPGKEAGE